MRPRIRSWSWAGLGSPSKASQSRRIAGKALRLDSVAYSEREFNREFASKTLRNLGKTNKHHQKPMKIHTHTQKTQRNNKTHPKELFEACRPHACVPRRCLETHFEDLECRAVAQAALEATENSLDLAFGAKTRHISCSSCKNREK